MIAASQNNQFVGSGFFYTCQNCGVVKELSKGAYQRYRSEGKTRKYCSKRCSNQANAKHGEAHHQYKRREITFTCLGCGKTKTKKVAPWYFNRPDALKFCDNVCKGKYYMTGEKNRSYIHGGYMGGGYFNPYCNKFDEPFKERVRAFFGFTCVECGKTQEENGKALHVHHVDYNPMVCCDRNPRLFVSLCGECHPKTNHNRRYWRQHFREILALQYGGKCYYTMEEMGV